MSTPKQPIGLTNFFGSITKCPPNPDAIRAIVFTRSVNLAVTNGATTEIQIPLDNFFIPVHEAARLNFTIPAKTASLYTINKLNLGGLDTNGEVKFIALLPDFGVGATSNSQFLQWTSIKSIDEGELSSIPQIGIGGNTSFNFYQVNGLDFKWGTYVDYTTQYSTGALYAATNGGLLKWDGIKTTLWNTVNSNLSTDYLHAIEIDSKNTAWIATNSGVLYFDETNQFTTKFNMTNSGLPSNNVTSIRLFGEYGVVGTDKGLSVFEKNGNLFDTYTIYNTPLLKHNYINKVEVAGDPLIFAGTTGGAYFMDSNTKHWGRFPLNSSTISGWNADDNIQDMAVYGTNMYFATNNGLVVVPYTNLMGATSSQFVGITASTIIGGSGGSGPYTNDFYSLRVKKDELYVGHGASGGVSILDLTTNSWYFAQPVSNLAGGPIKSLIPNFLSPNDKTVFAGNSIDSRIVKLKINTIEYDYAPGSGDLTDMLLSIPGEKLEGSYVVDSTIYPVDQLFWMVFSKPVSHTTAKNYISLNNNIDGSGNTILMGSTQSGIYTVVTYPVDSLGNKIELARASGYNYRLAMGCTATDNSFITSGLNVGFYTEDIVPVLGWNNMGKMLVFSGSDKHLVEGIYLRNPQNMDINITALIGN